MYSMCVHVCVSERVFAVNFIYGERSRTLLHIYIQPCVFHRVCPLTVSFLGFALLFFFLKVSVSPLPLVCKDIFSG